MAQNTVNFKDDLYVLGKECVFSAGCRFLNLSIRSSMITNSLKYFVSCPMATLVDVGSRKQVGGLDTPLQAQGFLQEIQGPDPEVCGPSILSA